MLDKTTRTKNIKLFIKDLKMPAIPRAFIKSTSTWQMLCLTVAEFNFEEQAVIYLHCFVKLPISEIANMTGLSTIHVLSTLILYSKRLKFKLDVLKKAVPYDAVDTVSIKEILGPEDEKVGNSDVRRQTK